MKLPTPFTAEQIRDNYPVGTRVRLVAEEPDGTVFFVWEVRATDAEGLVMRRATLAPDDTVLEGPKDSPTTWEDLRQHAQFPAENTVRARTDLRTPVGNGPGWRYVQTLAEDGATVVRTFHFLDAQPGAPVEMVVQRDGAQVFRMRQVERGA